jgi:hypothetical protein
MADFDPVSPAAGFGIRLNKQPPEINFRKKDKGGINYTSTVPNPKLDMDGGHSAAGLVAARCLGVQRLGSSCIMQRACSHVDTAIGHSAPYACPCYVHCHVQPSSLCCPSIASTMPTCI